PRPPAGRPPGPGLLLRPGFGRGAAARPALFGARRAGGLRAELRREGDSFPRSARLGPRAEIRAGQTPPSGEAILPGRAAAADRDAGRRGVALPRPPGPEGRVGVPAGVRGRCGARRGRQWGLVYGGVRPPARATGPARLPGRVGARRSRGAALRAGAG